jgi:hypothetical protein
MLFLAPEGDDSTQANISMLAQLHSQPPSASDRTVRSLTQLEPNASTTRTLNLISVWKKNSEDDNYKRNPLFKTPILNRSIIVKHRLRRNERDAFSDDRSVATKVIIPLDITDLRLGARSFFVGQNRYNDVITDLFSTTERTKHHDESLLELIASLPSLDPFLMRERLRKNSFNPARCYFEISTADTARMFDFVRCEITPLIGISFNDIDARLNEKISKLAEKILDNANDDELDPLRQGMGMDKASFEEGIFCWKGFLYYKWCLIELISNIKPVSNEIATARPTGPVTADDLTFIVESRSRLVKAIAMACETVRSTLSVYDDAYDDLTKYGQPLAFREFLLKAPSMFCELGERLGAVQHIVSFWRFRFPAGSHKRINAVELCDLFADFERSLNLPPKPPVGAGRSPEALTAPGDR